MINAHGTTDNVATSRMIIMCVRRGMEELDRFFVLFLKLKYALGLRKFRIEDEGRNLGMMKGKKRQRG